VTSEAKNDDMDTASLNEEKLKEVFTIEQVACALAGVSCKQAASAQVTRHERDLINAIQRQALPATYAYVDHDRTLIDWQTTRVTRQALLDWCKHRGVPLAILTTLATLATPTLPKPKRPPPPPNNNHVVLLKVIAGLTLLLADLSDLKSPEGKAYLDKRQLQNCIRCALDKLGIPSESVSKNAFTAILTDAFYEEIINIIDASKGSNDHKQPANVHRRRK